MLIATGETQNLFKRMGAGRSIRRQDSDSVYGIGDAVGGGVRGRQRPAETGIFNRFLNQSRARQRGGKFGSAVGRLSPLHDQPARRQRTFF